MAIDGTITLLSFLWIPKAKFYYFYSAPGDSLVIKVKAKKELDGVYLGRFNERPLLSEVYTKNVVWSAKSDTQTLWFIMFLQAGFFEKNEVSFEVWRFNKDSSLKNFNTRVIFERRKVFYVDTLWDSVPKLYKTWRVLIPPLSSSFTVPFLMVSSLLNRMEKILYSGLRKGLTMIPLDFSLGKASLRGEGAHRLLSVRF
jgi:hypothetical protein